MSQVEKKKSTASVGAADAKSKKSVSPAKSNKSKSPSKVSPAKKSEKAKSISPSKDNAAAPSQKSKSPEKDGENKFDGLKKDFKKDADAAKSQKSLKPSQQDDVPPGQINKSKSKGDLNDIKSVRGSVGKLDVKSNKSGSPAKNLELNKSQKSLSPKKGVESPSKPLAQSLNVDNRQPANSTLVNGVQNQLDPTRAGVNQSVAVAGNNGGSKAAAIGAPTEMTKTNEYGVNQSLNQLDNKIGVSEKEIQDQENRDNQELASRKSELEQYQKQKPPSKPDDLVQYLLRRLEASENSIKTAEEVIQNERALRKAASKEMKTQIKSLNAIVELEKRSLSDKVSAELDNTLKTAVKEKVTIKKQLDYVTKEKDSLDNNYEELREQYDELKAQEDESNRLNEESQKIIDELEQQSKVSKDKKNTLQTQNIEACQKMDKAIKDYNEVKIVITKLEESRNIMNRLMGPGGILSDDQRKNLLSNVDENDKMVSNIGTTGRMVPQQNQLMASGLNPVGSGSGLLNNAGRDYYNAAGIAGSQASLQAGNPYAINNNNQPSLPRNLGGINSQAAQQQQLNDQMLADNQEDDDFWYNQ